MIYTFFDKKSASLANKSTQSSGAAMLQNEKLVEELHKPIKESLHLKTIVGVLI